ncbi:ATP-binding cassette domain-containing protein [Castellaniella sp.]|uniref:ATP-binding cassette domain-containing protein n=1 Tax=Castellaniella sp. TaxID=1955812 RepID=UPI0035685C0D
MTSPAAPQPVSSKIVLRGIYKVYGTRAAQAAALADLQQGAAKAEVQQRTGASVGLAGVDADIPDGLITVIMGLSGSGKSTLIRHLNRLIDPSAGEVRVDGKNILALSLSELRAWRRQAISMVFQNFGLLPHLDVQANVAFGLKVRGEAAQKARETARYWLARVGLDTYEKRYPDELSGGMRQRVGLARALAMDAEILLMDEAFSSLDPLIRYDMQDQLLALQRELHKTIVFVTHDIDEALRVADHVVVLRDGRVEQAGRLEAIRAHPVNDYVRRFMSHRPEGSTSR